MVDAEELYHSALLRAPFGRRQQLADSKNHLSPLTVGANTVVIDLPHLSELLVDSDRVL